MVSFFSDENIIVYCMVVFFRRQNLPRVTFLLGLMIPVVEGGLVDTSLAPGDLPPRGLLALRLSNSYAVRTGTLG